MKSFLHKLVMNRASRLGVCLLFTAAMVALGAAGAFDPAVRAVDDGGEALPPNALGGMIVALDPGHGGYDGGARAHDSGLWEKQLTLEIAEKTERALAAAGARVVLTRREDTALGKPGGAARQRKRADLQARVDIAKEAGATVLLSIHLNDYRSRREQGPQVFYQRGGEDGRLLAGALQSALIAGLRPSRERAAMAGDYYVLRSAIPSALVECGFLSNAEEERLLRDPAYQERIAQSIARGLAEYKLLRERLAESTGKLGIF